MTDRSSLLAAGPAGIRAAIIEPNAAKAELLGYFCTHAWGFEVSAFDKTSSTEMTVLREIQPDLILAALVSSDIPVREFVLQLRKAAPSAKLILLVTQWNECLLHAIGGTDYHGLIYEPEESLRSIGAAVARVQEGFRFVSTGLQEAQRRFRLAPAAFPKLLSPREQQVLSCIARSLSDDEIAVQLNCAPGTALSHRRRLMYKLGLHSTPKLIRYGAEKGFDSGPPFPLAPESRSPKIVAEIRVPSPAR